MIQKAIALIHEQMGTKVRKGSGALYLVHLYAVYGIVTEYGADENLQVAALLHDIVEDAHYPRTMLAREFNIQVAKMVSDVTEDKTLPWIERKRAQVAAAYECPQDVAMLMIADKIANLQSSAREIPDSFEDYDGYKAYWAKFNAPPEDQIWFYSTMQTSLQANKRLRSPLEQPKLNTSAALAEFRAALSWFEHRARRPA